MQMQCLARAVARSARAAAEGYGGRRLASTSSGAARRYYIRQRRVALQERMRLGHKQHQLQRILDKLETMKGTTERNLDKIEGKLEASRGIVGFVLRTRFCAAISGAMIARFLFGEEKISANST